MNSIKAPAKLSPGLYFWALFCFRIIIAAHDCGASAIFSAQFFGTIINEKQKGTTMMHSFPSSKGIACVRKVFCTATIIILIGAASACATQGSANEQWAAHGYLTPGPTSDPEVIGVFDSVRECEGAADDWTSRQVVGNPVFADCYPVDRN